MGKRVEAQGGETEGPRPGRHLDVHPMELTPKDGNRLKKAVQARAHEGGIWTDPGLGTLIEKTPDTRAELLLQAINEYPQDVRTAITHETDIAAGTRPSPKAVIAQQLQANGEFSFCVNPYTGQTLADDIETGHPEILRENGIAGEMRDRFILGAIQVGSGDVQHIFYKELTPKKGLTKEDQRRICREILIENGMPPTIQKEVTVDTRETKTASDHRRGHTPRGATIPYWNHSDPGSGVVFEDGYAYTSYPVNTIGGIHPRFAMSMNRATEGAGPFEVYKNTETGVGHYVNNDLPVLVDDLKLTTTGPDHRLIIRAHSKHGEIPSIMDRIATWMVKSRITKELSKGD